MKDNVNTSRRMTLTGKVISNKMSKTLVVEVSRAYRHPSLKKVVRATKCYKAHYEGDERAIAPGTEVEIVEGRPVSKTKYMYVQKVIVGR